MPRENCQYSYLEGAAIEGHHIACVEELLRVPEIPDVADLRNCMDLTGLLTADIISMLVEHRANIEARTAHSGLLVSKAGSEKVNGPYQQVGEYCGRPLYENLFGAVVYCKGWWKIALSRANMEETEDRPSTEEKEPLGDLTEPPTGQWTLSGGRREDGPSPPPAPIIQWIARAGQAADSRVQSSEMQCELRVSSVGLHPMMEKSIVMMKRMIMLKMMSDSQHDDDDDDSS
eukprot:s4645_g1.t1